MAALTVEHLDAITREHKMKKLIDNIWDDSFFFLRMKKRNNMMYQSGDPFVIPIQYSKAKKGGAYAKYDSKSYQLREFVTEVQYQRKFYSEDIILYDRDLDVNVGENRIVDNVKTTVETAYKGLRDNMAEDIFRLSSSVTDPRDIKINTLEELFDTTTTTAFGNLKPNQFSGWTPSVETGYTLSTITNQIIKETITGVYKGPGRAYRPTLGITTQTIWNKIEELEVDKLRGNYGGTLELGKESILIHGIPVVVDTFQNAGYLDFLNEDYLHLIIHSNDNFKRDPWARSEQKHAMLSSVHATANFGCTRRDVHARISGLT